MSIHISVDFGKQERDELYSGRDPSWLDEKFEAKVIQELDEKCTVVEVSSQVERTAYVVFWAQFDKSNAELYEKFGKSGMTDIVEDIAENVYNSTSEKSIMEGRENA